MSDYIGITIGPIDKTLSIAETPIQLWYASYLFSSLTEKICEELTKRNLEILSPHYDPTSTKKDGIGRYPDRILIKASNDKLEEVKSCISSAKESIITIVKNDIKRVVGKIDDRETTSDKKTEEANEKNLAALKEINAADFLNSYFSIHCIAFGVEEKNQADKENNAILISGYMLDMLEQMPSFGVTDDNNVFKRLFGDKAKNSNGEPYVNIYMANCDFLQEITDSDNFKIQKGKNKSFKSIPDIAGSDKQKTAFKKYSYFAVVYADVDSMGTYIGTLRNDEIQDFSTKCFEYVEKAADKINSYGGMVIYAGGDDLLFLAPIEKNDKTIFDLIADIKSSFDTVFKDINGISVSFGVSIRYEKYPLYEALESARNALFVTAKNYSGKNAVVVDFSKNSGQAMKLCVSFERFTSFRDIIKSCRKPTDEAEKKEQIEKSEEVVNSAIYNMDILKQLFVDAESEDVIKNILNNQYDNKTQKTYENYISKISEKLYKHLFSKERKIVMYCNEGSVEEQYKNIKAFELIMRLGKFLSERGKENSEVSDNV